MPTDPIRDALVAKVDEFREPEAFDPAGMNYRETQAFVHGRATGAQAALRAYDEAKLMHGDTADADTTTLKRRRAPGSKKK